MPSLKLFGRRTRIGGDDLQPGAVGTIVVRVVQILIFVTPVFVGILRQIQTNGWDNYIHSCSSSSSSVDDNDDSEYVTELNYYGRYPLWLFIYQLTSLSYFLCSIGVEGSLIKASSTGTPTEPNGRQEQVTKLLEWKLTALNIANLVLLGLGMFTTNSIRVYYIYRSLSSGNSGNNDNYYSSSAYYGQPNLNNEIYYLNNNEEYILADEEETANDDWMSNDSETNVTVVAWSLKYVFPKSWWFCLIGLLFCQAIELLMGILSICVVCRLPKMRQLTTGSSDGYRHQHASASANNRAMMPPYYNSNATGLLYYRGSTRTSATSETTLTGAGSGDSGRLDEHHQRHPPNRYDQNNLHHESYYGPMEELWQTRCRMCCKVSGLLTCYLFGGRDLHTTGDFTQIATILTDYLEDGGGILDIVASDVVMGFMLLWRVQNQRQNEARQQLLQQQQQLSSAKRSSATNTVSSIAIMTAIREEKDGDQRHKNNLITVQEEEDSLFRREALTFSASRSNEEDDEDEDSNNDEEILIDLTTPNNAAVSNTANEEPCTMSSNSNKRGSTVMDSSNVVDLVSSSSSLGNTGSFSIHASTSLSSQEEEASNHNQIRNDDNENVYSQSKRQPMAQGTNTLLLDAVPEGKEVASSNHKNDFNVRESGNSHQGGVPISGEEETSTASQPSSAIEERGGALVYFSRPQASSSSFGSSSSSSQTISSDPTKASSGSQEKKGGASDLHRSQHRYDPSVKSSLVSSNNNNNDKNDRSSSSTSSSNSLYYDCHFRRVLSPQNVVDQQVMAEGARFARHALAIYSWKLYAYMYPHKVLCTLAQWRCRRRDRRQQMEVAASLSSPSSSTRRPLQQPEQLLFGASSSTTTRRRGPFIGDNAWHVHETCVLEHVGLLDREQQQQQQSKVRADGLNDVGSIAAPTFSQLSSSPRPCELIHGRFDNGLLETPYGVLLDHSWKSVVITIRGSLSLEDCVIDVLCEPESLEALGTQYGFNAQNEYCHSGVLRRTEWLYDDLKRESILESLFEAYPNYQLRVVGHSLGAGCALLLGFMLRQQYPMLKCWLYSPPGGLVTHRLACEAKQFVTSFILDCELVPRLSLQNMERLRDEILDLIQRTKVSKMTVVKDFIQTAAAAQKSWISPDQDSDSSSNGEPLASAVSTVMPFPDDNSDLLYPKDFHRNSNTRSEGNAISDDRFPPPTTEFASQLEHFRRVQRDRKRHRASFRGKRHIHSHMYPPGNIVHLVKTSETRNCSTSLLKWLSCWTSNVGSHYTPLWAKLDEDFNEIVIGPTMGTDHFPNRVCLEMEHVATDLFHLSSPYIDLEQEYGA